MNMDFHHKLPIPQVIKTEYPVTEEMARVKKERDRQIRAVFEEKDSRFILIVGPCSADRNDAVTEYMGRLKKLSEQVKDKIIVIPRLYTNKPRTTGDGYKGMLHQPDPHRRPDMLMGILSTRLLHMNVLRDFGFTCADEMLYPENHRYLSDIMSYAAVGARSAEDQQHRLTASGLDIPVGMKNPTGGDLGVMMNSIWAAHHPHTFIYRGWEVESKGNPLAHAILRGYRTNDGRTMPNYGYGHLLKLHEMYMESGLSNPAVIVDTNHANSGKDYLKQADIALDVLESRRKNSDIAKFCKGLMIESYLVDGAQDESGCTYGQSITDPCLGWEKTEKLVLEIAERL